MSYKKDAMLAVVTRHTENGQFCLGLVRHEEVSIEEEALGDLGIQLQLHRKDIPVRGRIFHRYLKQCNCLAYSENKEQFDMTNTNKWVIGMSSDSMSNKVRDMGPPEICQKTVMQGALGGL